MKIRRALLKDVVTVRTMIGETSYSGPAHANAVQIRCLVDNRRRLIRSDGGDEVVAAARLVVHPDDEAVFTPESLVSVNGVDSQVVAVARHTAPRSARLHHLTVDLA